eukprot:CAMPEP_0183376412 /NCGR_PEP_ID=MMETSP0164_2-20130417/120208_1 /TAXON_ID=221442 /ORGANISM="Coccolithus pelagicus ssp braarudi, Strain PLY182g" /LENGTH=47 /DNA_ID= /DNA_START= /DNA_END= /DNA_ORIENTATION=
MSVQGGEIGGDLGIVPVAERPVCTCAYEAYYFSIGAKWSIASLMSFE